MKGDKDIAAILNRRKNKLQIVSYSEPREQTIKSLLHITN